MHTDMYQTLMLDSRELEINQSSFFGNILDYIYIYIRLLHILDYNLKVFLCVHLHTCINMGGRKVEKEALSKYTLYKILYLTQNRYMGVQRVFDSKILGRRRLQRKDNEAKIFKHAQEFFSQR